MKIDSKKTYLWGKYLLRCMVCGRMTTAELPRGKEVKVGNIITIGTPLLCHYEHKHMRVRILLKCKSFDRYSFRELTEVFY